VFALVGNAIFLSVRERIQDHAVLQTLGYSHGLIASLIVAEGLVLGLLGGVLGVLGGAMVSAWGLFTFSVEGFSVHIYAGAGSIVLGLVLSALVGILAGLLPAWQASRMEIAACFRAV
jgi:putative ABC transport system permease protein